MCKQIIVDLDIMLGTDIVGQIACSRAVFFYVLCYTTVHPPDEQSLVVEIVDFCEYLHLNILQQMLSVSFCNDDEHCHFHFNATSTSEPLSATLGKYPWHIIQGQSSCA